MKAALRSARGSRAHAPLSRDGAPFVPLAMSTVATLQPVSSAARAALYDLLRHPVAVDAAGRALDPQAQERVLELAARVAAQLRELSAGAVHLQLATRPPTLALFDEGCAVELEPAVQGSVWIALDPAASRALVDALALRHLGLRGAGEPTGAERALLEFAALACLDRCGAARLRRFVHGRELARVTLEASTSALEFDLRCGASGGRARVLVASTGQDAPLLLDPQREVDELELRVALPRLSISRAEYDGLEAGDVLLLGVESLSGFAARIELVTPGGWRVAGAELAGDCALSLTVRIGALDVRVLPRPSTTSSGVTLAPFLAARRVARTTFERWREGDELTLDKRPEAALDVFASDGARRTAELVRVAGELGLRVCSLQAAPLERA